MSARAIAIHGNEMSGERRANLEIKSECPALIQIGLLKRAIFPGSGSSSGFGAVHFFHDSA